MTIYKQVSVSSESHQKHLSDYINNDEKVLLRSSQNMEECADIKQWASFMAATRKALGCDAPSRMGRNGKPAKNVVLIHAVFSFLPEECSVNGGKLTPEDCMRYAEEYVSTYLPNHEVVLALHDECCEEDGVHRFSVHAVINRPDTRTHKRLCEGRWDVAKRRHVARIRQMDDEWGLRQVKAGEPNSRIHKRQPSRVEKEMAARGEKPYKTNLRELCRIAARRAESIYEFRDLLDSWDVDTSFRNGKLYVTDRDNDRLTFSVARLDVDLDMDGLACAFRGNIVRAIQRKGQAAVEAIEAERREAERIGKMVEDYLADARERYVAYRQTVKGMAGAPYADLPRLGLARPPKEIERDPEVRDTILAYWRGGDELRRKLACDVPRGRPTGTQQTRQPEPQRRRVEQARPQPRRSRER